ncbi:MAG: lysophospholipid acyltransferase family protein [Brooklawnia sp.]|jgi:hypothetical protein
MAALKDLGRLPTDDLERLPEQAAVVALNRVGPFDHHRVVASLPRQATVVITPGDGLRLRLGLRTARWDGRPGSREDPAEVLRRGELLVVFPEGPAGNDGAVHKGHAEFAALALANHVPIVPAALLPLTHPEPDLRYRLRIGEPISTERFRELGLPSVTVDGFILRGLTDLVMTRISQLAGRRYVDAYTGAGIQPIRWRPAVASSQRPSRAERRTAEAQRQAAEAELARLLDEQDAMVLDQAVEAARLQAERAALADDRARARRRSQN